MSLLAEIQKMHGRRRELMDQISAIDDEMSRAGLELTGRENVRSRKPKWRAEDIKADGSRANLILASLAASEPRTVGDISAYTGLSIFVIGRDIKAMVNAGQLYRRTLKKQGSPSIYARTVEALGRDEPAQETPAEPEAVDEVG